MLRALVISDTPFVDDAFLTAVGETCIAELTIIKMSGSRLSDTGIAAVMASEHLKALHLVDIASRLSKQCWANVQPWLAFRSIRIAYSEAVAHHRSVAQIISSWTQLIHALQLGHRSPDIYCDVAGPS